MQDELILGAVYERTVAASLERIWENVHDWEHLPWLHDSAFSAIELDEAADWGWRARIRIAPDPKAETLLVELRRDSDREFYHTRTLEGPGKGADTQVTLTPQGPRTTHVRVEFWLAVADDAQAKALGAGLVTVYTRLWDEDEAMMLMRQDVIDGLRSGRARAQPGDLPAVPLGPWQELSARVPFLVSTERGKYRVVETEAGFFAHSVLCPHWGGPMEEAEIAGEYAVCPWHGYRFDLADGRVADGKRCHMKKPPRIEHRSDGEAELVFEAAGSESLSAKSAD